VGSLHAPGALAAGTGLHRPVHRHPRRAAAGFWFPRRHGVIDLRAAEDCRVEFITASGRYLFQAYNAGGMSKRRMFRRAVDMRLGNPGGVKLTVDGTKPLPPGTTGPITLRIRRQGKIFR
jgi:hypothetical protein